MNLPVAPQEEGPSLMEELVEVEGMDNESIQMFLRPGENVDLFSDLHPLMVGPVERLLRFAAHIKTTPHGSPAIRAIAIQYLRLCASKNRASRNEYTSTKIAEKRAALATMPLDLDTERNR